MPKYTYKCHGCKEYFDVVHGIFEEQAGCPMCFNHVVKRVPQMPHVHRKQTSKGGKVGDEVKRAIEENRAVLEKEKKIRVELPNGD